MKVQCFVSLSSGSCFGCWALGPLPPVPAPERVTRVEPIDDACCIHRVRRNARADPRLAVLVVLSSILTSFASLGSEWRPERHGSSVQPAAAHVRLCRAIGVERGGLKPPTPLPLALLRAQPSVSSVCPHHRLLDRWHCHLLHDRTVFNHQGFVDWAWSLPRRTSVMCKPQRAGATRGRMDKTCVTLRSQVANKSVFILGHVQCPRRLGASKCRYHRDAIITYNTAGLIVAHDTGLLARSQAAARRRLPHCAASMRGGAPCAARIDPPVGQRPA
jgi:hypothetical protein